MTVPDLPAELVAAEPSIANELDEAILVGAVDAPVYGWYPSTIDEAEWAARKLLALRSRAAEVNAQYQVWRARIDAWQADELNRIVPGFSFFESRLKTYALTQRAIDERNNKTTRLPSVKITTRAPTGAPKVIVVDEDAVLEWAASGALDDETYEKVVKVETSIRLSHLREIVEVVDFNEEEGFGGQPIVTYKVVHKATGEIVDGVAIEWPDTTPTATVEVD